MFLDLDRFKVVNDTLGHAMGDRLLQAVTHRLEKCLRRGGDTLSRFGGGDEFTLLLPSIHGNDDARNIARKLINALKAPFQLGDHEVFVGGVSIGISVFPPEAGETMDLLIQNADIAMYHVKARGKDGYRFYSDSMSINTANRLSLERDLRLALERNELRVFYQPQVCSRSNRVVGLEAWCAGSTRNGGDCSTPPGGISCPPWQKKPGWLANSVNRLSIRPAATWAAGSVAGIPTCAWR